MQLQGEVSARTLGCYQPQRLLTTLVRSCAVGRAQRRVCHVKGVALYVFFSKSKMKTDASARFVLREISFENRPPAEVRFAEIWREGYGHLSARTTAVDRVAHARLKYHKRRVG